jgi:hypothetical protein
MLTIAGAIGAEWLFVHFTGALQRPAPPAAAGAAAAVRVAAANRGALIFAMVLGGVVGLTAAISVQDTQARDHIVSMLVLPVPMIAVLALSLAVAPHRVLALCLLPLILAAGTYLRRFGPAGVRVGPLLFTGYLFGFLLGSLITLGDTGWLTAEIGVGIVVAIVVKFGVFHDTSERALRRTQRSYAARARRLAGLALAAFDEPGPGASRRLRRDRARLGEATHLIDGQLADPGAAQADSAAALLHQRLFDSWLALANLARFAAALGRSPLHAGQREQVREILASLRDGRFDRARASALAFAEALTAPADPDGDNTENIAHRFAGSVTDFTDALSQWLVLGAQDQPDGGALFTPAVPLRQGGSLSVTAAATAEASSTAEPGRYLRRAAVAPYIRTAIQVGVAICRPHRAARGGLDDRDHPGLGAAWPLPSARRLRVLCHRHHGNGVPAVLGARGLHHVAAGPAARGDRHWRGGSGCGGGRRAAPARLPGRPGGTARLSRRHGEPAPARVRGTRRAGGRSLAARRYPGTGHRLPGPGVQHPVDAPNPDGRPGPAGRRNHRRRHLRPPLRA